MPYGHSLLLDSDWDIQLDASGNKAADVKDIQLVRKDTSSPAGDAITPRTLTGDIRLTMEDGETYGISI